MKEEEAKQLIRKTLESPFDKGQFVQFAKELFNHMEEVRMPPYRGKFPQNFEPHIQMLEIIGRYEDPEKHKADVLLVHLKKESTLERGRTAQRNFIAWYLNSPLSGGFKDAAFVAFVSPDSEDWRFSLVKMEYKDFGKTKELTPARRWSFLVGKNENSHTAQAQLLPLLERDDANPHLSDLEKAFNIEKVTKEFFLKYRDLFITINEALDAIVEKDAKIKKDFKEKNVSAVDFSKKLLGQIVFLYFLQKKGWFGVARDAAWGTGSKHFLRELFKKQHADYKNFFNDILEPLFYEALREDRSHNDDYFSQLKSRIPFLNGGLFDPINDYDWVHTDILLPNELFSNEEETKQGDKGTGILDVFDRYNFTVKEDEPLEKEVAIDPEMLGKVFENLLEVKDRKSKGTYYTPREIVHYMCQESLINYLSTELAEIPKKEISDFIHHGEMALEYTPETYGESKDSKTGKEGSKKFENIFKNAQLVDEKLSGIRVCDPAVGSGAFLVGMMNEIVRARNALSSYLSFRVGAGSEPAPTIYDFKRHAIQESLYGVDIDAGATEIAKLRLWLSLVVDEDDIKQIKPLPNLDYKIVCGNSLLGVEKDLLNDHLFNQLEKLKPLHFDETSAGKKQKYKQQIDALIQELTHNETKFDFEIYFSEVFHEKKGFDVVIANPPYGIIFDNKRKRLYEQCFQSFIRNNDIYIAFYEKGIQLMLDKGVLVYISPNTFLNGDYFKHFRKTLTEKTTINEIIDFKENSIFDDPTVFVCVLNCSKNKRKEYPYDFNLKVARNSIFDFDVEKVTIKSSTENKLKCKNPLFDKILPQKNVYSIDHFFYVKDVRFNYWTKGRGKVRGNSIGGRIFYVGKKHNQNDIPFLKGRNIHKYKCLKPTSFLRHDYEKLLSPEVDVFRFSENFLKICPKIVYRQTSDRIIAALDENSNYLDKTVHLIVPKEKDDDLQLKFILALLNSSLYEYLYRYISQEREGRTFSQVKTVYIKQLPTRKIPSIEQQPFITLVDKILAITKGGDYLTNPAKQAKVRDYEREIDELVYKLYDLTPEEIKIVENSFEDNKK